MTNRLWTTHELELYGDGELDETRHAALTDDLRRDPALRARLAAAVDLDRLLEQALASPVEPSTAPPHLVGVGAGAAAAIVLLAAVIWVVLTEPGSAPKPAPEPGITYDPVRLVLTVPARATDEEPPKGSEVEAASPPPPVMVAAPPPQFDEALARGDVGRALQLLAAAAPPQRESYYRRISELITSASAAEALLDRMTPRQQLEACGHMVGEGHLRRVAFERLGALWAEADLADDVRHLVDELAADPDYRSWLRSYVPGSVNGV